jgi:saccharopine dehydrogenase-like NADP-dependent oxidoreductase
MSKTQYVVLGGGLVGGFIARTLAVGADCRVTLVDRDTAVLESAARRAPLATSAGDLADAGVLRKCIEEADVAVSAVPGRLGFATLRAVLEAGKPCVDIAFCPEDARALDALAQQRGVRAVVDCGVMPGLGGMLAMDLARRLDEHWSLRILVGGLPVERRWPFEYKAPFSPSDVIEEYVRPARLRVGGRTVQRPALSGVEHVDVPGVGTLEAFNTDGLRTLLEHLPFPDMTEMTLRYPGHAEKVLLLRELGFFSQEPLDVGGARVRPLDLTSRLLFDDWRLMPGMREFTVLIVEANGLASGAAKRLRYFMLDYTDPATGDFSMARTTGWPAVLVARLLAAGALHVFPPGVIAPEKLASDADVLQQILAGLKQAGIELTYEEREA